MEEDEGGADRNQNKEIFSKLVIVELKRFYVDIKLNDRGCFCRISETDVGGSRSKVVCPLAGLEEFKTLLGKFDTLCQMMNASGSVETVTENQAQPIRTESLRCENKLFFFDLRANNRGRFLKISQVMGPRSAIVIPSSGIATIRDCLMNALEECGQRYQIPVPAAVTVLKNGGDAPGSLPSHEMRVEHKRFFFDMGNNSRGTFLRVSELSGSNRTSITIPHSGWQYMRDILDECMRTHVPSENLGN